MTNELSLCTGAGSAQEVNVAWAVLVPQLVGLTSGARAPPLNRTLNALNGNCGLSENVAVS
jgi:hypothetical protein